MRRRLLIALAALLVAPAGASAAAKAPVFGLRAAGNAPRGYFVYTLAPGATKSGAITVSNVGNARGTVSLFASDATTGPTSGTVYETSSRPKGVGSWVTLSRASATLAPGQHATVPFTVRVPSDAKPGQWVGGIVAETSQKVAQQKPGSKARVQIKIRDLTIVAVQVDVPGKTVQAFTIGKITAGGARGFQKLFVGLTNAGNVLAHPRGSVVVHDAKGAVVERLPFKLDTFLPQTSIDYPLLLKTALGPGSYTADVALRFGGRAVTAHPSFTVSNSDVQQVFSSSKPTAAPPVSVSSSSSSLPSWVWAAIVAGVLVLLGIVLLLVLRARRPAAGGTTLHRVPAPAPAPANGATTIPEPGEPAPAAAEAVAAADHEHEWDVAYDRGQLGGDGVWRFPHSCRRCGAQVLARDVSDAASAARSAG